MSYSNYNLSQQMTSGQGVTGLNDLHNKYSNFLYGTSVPKVNIPSSTNSNILADPRVTGQGVTGLYGIYDKYSQFLFGQHAPSQTWPTNTNSNFLSNPTTGYGVPGISNMYDKYSQFLFGTSYNSFNNENAKTESNWINEKGGSVSSSGIEKFDEIVKTAGDDFTTVDAWRTSRLLRSNGADYSTRDVKTAHNWLSQKEENGWQEEDYNTAAEWLNERGSDLTPEDIKAAKEHIDNKGGNQTELLKLLLTSTSKDDSDGQGSLIRDILSGNFGDRNSLSNNNTSDGILSKLGLGNILSKYSSLLFG